MNVYNEINKLVTKYKDSPEQYAVLQETSEVFCEYLTQLDAQIRKQAVSRRKGDRK